MSHTTEHRPQTTVTDETRLKDDVCGAAAAICQPYRSSSLQICTSISFYMGFLPGRFFFFVFFSPPQGCFCCSHWALCSSDLSSVLTLHTSSSLAEDMCGRTWVGSGGEEASMRETTTFGWKQQRRSTERPSKSSGPFLRPRQNRCL